MAHKYLMFSKRQYFNRNKFFVCFLHLFSNVGVYLIPIPRDNPSHHKKKNHLVFMVWTWIFHIWYFIAMIVCISVISLIPTKVEKKGRDTDASNKNCVFFLYLRRVDVLNAHFNFFSTCTHTGTHTKKRIRRIKHSKVWVTRQLLLLWSKVEIAFEEQKK